MYIVTRRDIPPGYQGVQSCHAVARLLSQQPRPKGWDDTMVWLSCSNEDELGGLYQRAEGHGLKPVEFLEPDLFHRMTAFAVFVPSEKYYLFSHLPLSLSKTKLTLNEAFFILRMAGRNLISTLLAQIHLKKLQNRFDKKTQSEVEQFGEEMGRWVQ